MTEVHSGVVEGGRKEGEVDSLSAKKVCQSAIVSYLKFIPQACGYTFIQILEEVHERFCEI